MRLVPSILPLLALVAVVGGALSCQTVPDKRLLQYLNQEGFGKRYTGNAEEEDYLTIGDRINYVDAIQPVLRGSETVGLDGTVTLPEVGSVHVAGMTRSEVEALFQQKFAPYFVRTDITVAIQSSGLKGYWVLGEVGGVGQRPFPGDLTIFEAVMAAGPSGSTANLGRVRLIRPDPREPFIITVNVNDMIRSGDSTYNVHVRENDIIYVPPTMFAQLGYFVVGLIAPVTTVLQSVSQSLFSLLRLSRFNTGGGGGGRRGRGNNQGFF